ncbi:hypothetical protein QBC40DRAFT_283240 [Triangularia verruculosa]|uniref:Zn(2)-C6 fungal-type domain-containing protein n=1 Tax=Triangularia verruculosa TaxID=2587418 RepID=A0AAN6XDX1_9PEZI|nr:hypothetical protein QBC40DRAFT_283240 [Triangularia verruculosa]
MTQALDASEASLKRSRSPSDVSNASSCTLPLHSPQRGAQEEANLEDPPSFDISTTTADSTMTASPFQLSTCSTTTTTGSLPQETITKDCLKSMMESFFDSAGFKASTAEYMLRGCPVLPASEAGTGLDTRETISTGSIAAVPGPQGRKLKPVCTSCKCKMRTCDGEGPPCGTCKRHGWACDPGPLRQSSRCWGSEYQSEVSAVSAPGTPSPFLPGITDTAIQDDHVNFRLPQDTRDTFKRNGGPGTFSTLENDQRSTTSNCQDQLQGSGSDVHKQAMDC